MAITQCSECGGKVSTTAQACPHCGAQVGATEAPTVLRPLTGPLPGPPVEQAQQEASHPGTVLIPLAVYAGVMLLVLVGLPPLALVLAAAAAGAICAWPVGQARAARSLVTYAGLHITLRLWSESVMSSVPYIGPGSGASAEEIIATVRQIASMGMVPPGNWWEVEWWFALAFLGGVGWIIGGTVLFAHCENLQRQAD